MVRLAIRDDDTNFFTKVEDLELVYKDFNSFPISFAVIPTVEDVSTKGACPDTKGNDTPRFVGDNVELCSWLKDKLQEGSADVLLHGITHAYKVGENIRLAEMEWRTPDIQLFKLIQLYKNKFEELFDYKVSVFVAPSNKISKGNLNIVVKNGFDFSGIIPLNFQRKITLKNIYNYVKRIVIRAVYKFPYPAKLTYSDHSEINACGVVSFEYLKKMFDFCNKHNYPMVINVHYWHMRDNAEYLETVRSFVMDYAIPHGAIPTRLSELFKL